MRSKKVPCHGKFGKEEESEFLDDIQAGIYRSLIGILSICDQWFGKCNVSAAQASNGTGTPFSWAHVQHTQFLLDVEMEKDR